MAESDWEDEGGSDWEDEPAKAGVIPAPGAEGVPPDATKGEAGLLSKALGWALNQKMRSLQNPATPADVVRSGIDGVTYGTGSLLSAAAQAPFTAASEHIPLTEAFDKERRELAPAYTGAVSRSPEAMVGGMMLTGNAKDAARLPLAKELLRNVAKSAGVGLVAGAGQSPESLTENPMGVLADAAGSALVAGGLGGVLTAASRLPGARQWVQGKMAGAKADAVSQAEAKVEKEIASKLGSYRSGIQSASRDLEVLERAANGANPELAAEAKAYLASEQGRALIDQVARNKLLSAPERIKEMQALKAEFEAAQAAKASTVANKADETLSSPFQRAVRPRLTKYLVRTALPVAGAAIGSSMDDGPAGAIIGTGLGALGAAALGQPGTAFANMAKDPGVRHALWRLVNKATPPAPMALEHLAIPARAGAAGLLPAFLSTEDEKKAETDALVAALRKQ